MRHPTWLLDWNLTVRLGTGAEHLFGICIIKFIYKNMRQCEVCGKGSIVRGQRKKLRGNYNPTPKKRKYPNLHNSVLPSGKKGVVCTSCLKKITKSAN